MNLRTEFFLAWRYLRPKRSVVSVITCISIVGVTLGVGVLIVVLSVMTGFTDLMKEKILETTAHLQIREAPWVDYIEQPETVIKELQASGVRAIPVVTKPVLIQKDKKFFPKFAIGLEPELKQGTIDIEKAITANGGTFSLNAKEVVVSYVIADTLGVGVGDKILLHAPNRISKMMVISEDGGKVELAKNAEMYLPEEFTISGIFSFGHYKYDKDVLFMNLDDADDLFGLPWGAATSIYVWTDDPFNTYPVVKTIKEKFPSMSILTWKQMNKQLLQVLATEKTMMFFLMFFIVLVAAFSTCNTLIMVVINKTREIGLLKSLGATSSSVMRIFIIQGFLVGLIGTIVGNGFGIAVIYWRNQIMQFVSSWTGVELFPKELYNFSSLPARIVPEDIIVIATVSMLLCTLGGVIPAWRAAKLDPAKTLRYE